VRKLLLLILVAFVFLSGCNGGGGSAPPPAITVAFSVAPANSMTVSASGNVAATVMNDPANRGVDWSATCGSAGACGSFNPAHTASGASTAYTAPANVPSGNTVTITATSTADATKSASAAITVVAGASVAVALSTAPPASLTASSTANVAATVSNDPANKGVDWSATCGSAGACGSFNPAHTASGASTTYTAPASVPAGNTVTITATSTADATKSASATITVTPPPVAVALSTAPPASLLVSGTANVAATVTNDSANKGVDWSATCGSAGACGSFNPAHTASGASTTYTAPASVPAGNTVTITATSSADATKSASAMITVTLPPVAVAISAAPPVSMLVNGTANVAATVTNDPANQGVDWSAACGSAGACGSFNPAHTASGASTTYTAPASVPAGGTVTITATSTADATKSASARMTVTVAPISVTISPTNPTVAVSATQQFTATVTNDSSAQGVTWALSQSGAACSPTCGAVSPSSDIGNSPQTTYTAPATVPIPATVTITATSVADPSQSASITLSVAICGSGNESVFKGQYAFLFQGFDANGPMAIVGAFSADGTGKIAQLGGVEDINNSAGVQTNVAINSAASSYTVGTDNRGCLAIATASGTSTYHFSLSSISPTSGVPTKGRMVEFDNTGTLGSGVLRLQDPSAFVNSAISGGYAFGGSSTLSLTGGNRFAVVGAFTSNGAGGITGGEVDANTSGTVDGGTAGPLLILNTSTYSVASNGRATFTLNFAGSAVPVHGVFYVVSAGEALTMSADPQSGAGSNAPFAGSALQQSGGPFGASSLNANSVFYAAGLCGSCPAAAPVAPSLAVGVFSSTMPGNFSLNRDINKGGTLSTQAITGTYTVDSSGRVLLTQTGAAAPFAVMYLASPNEGFVATTDRSVEAGFVEPQIGAPFFLNSLPGTYFVGTTNQANQNVADYSGLVNFDVRDGANAISDNASIGPTPTTPNLNPGQTFANDYALTNNASTPGRGTISIGATTNLIFYIISHHSCVGVVACTSKLVFMDATTNTNPALTIGETK